MQQLHVEYLKSSHSSEPF